MDICYYCFREKTDGGVCPYCGYDPTGAEEKYPRALKHGSILSGRYIVGRVLGQGGFGITYIALDDRTKGRVAIKEYFPAEFAGREEGSSCVQPHSGDRKENFDFGKEKFLEEAKTLAAFIGDEHIVRIYNYFEENGTAYFTMEYVEGQPLDRYMAAHGGFLTPEETDDLLLPLMEALEKVHAKGIVHRDIAPDNIIVQPNGKAKLIDFGAARYSTGEKSQSLDVVIKHGFAPREQYTRRGRQGPFTDVYAMAATYYYAITGKLLPDAIERTEGEGLISPSSMGIQISEQTEEALDKALEIMAPDRYQSMDEFRLALTEADPRYAGRPAVREPELLPAPVKHRKKTGRIALACGLAVVALAALFLLPKRAKPETVIPAAPVETEAPAASPAPTEEPAATAAPAAELSQYEAQPEIRRPWFTDDRSTIAISYDTILAVYPDGSARSIVHSLQNYGFSDWTDIVAVDGYSSKYTVFGLQSNGKVIMDTGRNSTLLDWENVVAIDAGTYHVIGLKEDGTVVGYGKNASGQCDVSDWTDIIAVSAGSTHTVGLRADGTVVTAGGNTYGQCETKGREWTNIIAVSAGASHTVGLRADGTVVAAGARGNAECEISDWTDIVAVSAGYYSTFGLRADGTVVIAGGGPEIRKDIADWTDVVYLSKPGERWTNDYIIGICADGTVLEAGNFPFINTLTNKQFEYSLEDLIDVSIPSMER